MVTGTTIFTKPNLLRSNYIIIFNVVLSPKFVATLENTFWVVGLGDGAG